jgi:hypothetical protein
MCCPHGLIQNRSNQNAVKKREGGTRIGLHGGVHGNVVLDACGGDSGSGWTRSAGSEGDARREGRQRRER